MQTSGILNALIYVFMTALSFVFLDVVYTKIDPLISLLAMITIAIGWLNLINIKNIYNVYKACLNNIFTYLSMSSMLAIDWICSIYGVHFADPFVYLSCTFAMVSLCGYIGTLYSKKTLRNNTNWISILIILIAILSIIIFYQGRSSLLLGILLATICGISFFGYGVSSSLLLKSTNLSSSEIIATRFWVLFFVVSAIVFNKYSAITVLEIVAQNIVRLIILSTTTLIIPIYFYQEAIKKNGAIKTSVILGFTPPITYVLYSVTNQNFIMLNFFISLLMFIALIIEHLKFVLNYSET